MSAEPAFRSHFARHAGDFSGEAVELVDHGVEGFFELQNFSAHVHCNLAREIAVRDGRCHLCNIADLAGKVAGHEVDVFSEILPGSTNAEHLCLTTEFAFGTYFAGYAGYFAGECVELVDHRVDGVLEFEDFAFDVDRDFAGEIAASYGGCDFGDVADLGCQVSSHRVYGVG